MPHKLSVILYNKKVYAASSEKTYTFIVYIESKYLAYKKIRAPQYLCGNFIPTLVKVYNKLC